MTKRAIILANFIENVDTSRAYICYEYLKKRGYNVEVIYSYFSHSKKTNRKLGGNDFIAINTIKYSSNVSILRYVSHLHFAIIAVNKLRNKNPDLIYVNIPSNILGILIAYFRDKSNSFLIIDVLDLWPESFPFPLLFKKIFMSTIGRVSFGMRSWALNSSDVVLTESNYFFSQLNLNMCKAATGVIQLKKIVGEEKIDINNTSDELKIAYLGNIGKIYDFDNLIKIAAGVNMCRKLSIEIIGDGDYKVWLLTELDKKNIKYKYHGYIFDNYDKQEILSSCWFGYNGFKATTNVALSYKSIDYFSYGLPIINSAKGDSTALVMNYNLGFNFDENSVLTIIDSLVSVTRTEIINQKSIVSDFFVFNFSSDSFDLEMDCFLNKIK